MIYQFRALPTWPYKPTQQRRSRYTFKAGWNDTLGLLDRELGYLGGRAVIIAAGFREQDLRLDGMPRANALAPSHPGIELSFDSDHGRLVYACDVCELWQHNVRSIALGLESLRAVDRYGISRKGEQYAGWLKLTTSAPNADHGRELVQAAGSVRAALMRHHPDHGGDPRDLADVQAFRQLSGTTA